MFNRFLQFIAQKLGDNALLRDVNFRRYWLTTSLNSMAEQVSNLAIPLSAALLLYATPSQMGLLVAMEMLPFALFSLPGGVWLDRRRKFPILLSFEMIAGLSLISIPLAYAFGWLSMGWLYTVAFLTGTCNTIGGSCAQIFMTCLVSRDKLYDAQAKFALTDSASRLIGPGMAGLLVQSLTAPLALLFNGMTFLVSVLNLSRIKVQEPEPAPSQSNPWQEMLQGLRFVWQHPILWPLAWSVALWQILFNGYQALQILFSTRELGLSPGMLGMVQMMGGLGVLVSSALLKPLSERFGTGMTIMIGMSTTAISWVLMANVPAHLFGSTYLTALLFGCIVFCFDCGLMLYFMPYLALRLKVTPDEFLGRVISTMRFLTVAVAPLGAFSAGWLGQHFGLRLGLVVIATGAMLLSMLVYFTTPLRSLRE